jgi:RsmE family RNA methyltransferase
VNGPQGKGTIVAASDRELSLEFSWGSDPPTFHPLTLIVGLPRPQTARSILREVTSLGASAIHFITTEKGEANYGQSTLWRTGEWRRHVLAGAEQAFCTQIPEVTYSNTLTDVIATLPTELERIALDNYEAPLLLSELSSEFSAHVLAVGPERGWSATERNVLRTSGFHLANLGARVLRTETACIAAISLIKAKIGSM